MTRYFDDRLDAGRRLAAALAAYEGRNPLVLAIPRGAVAMGAEIAKLLGGEEGCAKCHHQNAPGTMGTPCSSCHRDMYVPASAFDHALPQDEFKGNDGCIECHPKDKDPLNAKSCAACHQEMYPEAKEGERVDYIAPSYQDAMHGKCETCHREEAAKQGKPEIGLCSSCHVPAADGDLTSAALPK